MNGLWKSDFVFFNGDAYFDAALTDIDGATKKIDLETYIFETDEFGRKVIKRLAAAVDRGVKVRVLVDAVGSANWIHTLVPLMKKAGIELRVFRPLPKKIDIALLAKVFIFSDLESRKKLHWFNGRNHRKSILIDDEIAYIGSMNITGHHLYKISGQGVWRDTSVRLEGTQLRLLSEAFERAWQSYRFPLREETPISLDERKHFAQSLMRINDSRLKRRLFNRDLLKHIRHAKGRIWITNAYFIPKGILVWALAKAALRKVDVRIILPEKSDVFFVPWLTKLFYVRLLRSGVRIFEYRKSMLHAKTIIIDDWALVGTSNLNHRSFHHDLEVDAVITSPLSKQDLNERFIADLKHCHEITEKETITTPKYQTIFGNFLFPMRHWF